MSRELRKPTLIDLLLGVVTLGGYNAKLRRDYEAVLDRQFEDNLKRMDKMQYTFACTVKIGNGGDPSQPPSDSHRGNGFFSGK